MVGWPDEPDSPLHSGVAGPPGAAGTGAAVVGAAAGGAGRTEPVVPPPNRFQGKPVWPRAGPAAAFIRIAAAKVILDGLSDAKPIGLSFMQREGSCCAQPTMRTRPRLWGTYKVEAPLMQPS